MILITLVEVTQRSPLGLRVERKDGSNVLGGSQSYATAEEFESPQVLAMNWWIGEDANRNGHCALGVREDIFFN